MLRFVEMAAPERTLDPAREERVYRVAEEGGRFFERSSDLYRALERVTARLGEADIPYALIGALALGEYGYRRLTVHIDLLLTREGLAAFKDKYLGLGYVEKSPGSKGFRDTETGVVIDVVLSGDYPGDGRPKPVRFPDPGEAAERGERLALLPVERFLELKLASGASAPHRLRDLADVLELIRLAQLPEALGAAMDSSVRDKYRELWQAAQVQEPE